MFKPKSQLAVENQFLYTLSQIIETFPQYSLSQHLFHFLRKKSDNTAPYFWSSENLLSKIEQYYDELKEDLLQRIEEGEDYG